MNPARKRILLVEDNPVHQEVESDALVAAGYDVMVAASLDQARSWLPRLRTEAADWLVVLDIRLAGDMNAGIRLIEDLEKDSDLRRIPVQVISALRPEEIQKELGERQLRRRPILPKPFFTRELVDAVSELPSDIT